jgi:hypothetical protein
MSSSSKELEFDLEKLRCYLWDFLLPELSEQLAAPIGVSRAWERGASFEGFDRFTIRLKKFKVRRVFNFSCTDDRTLRMHTTAAWRLQQLRLQAHESLYSAYDRQ